MRQFLNKALSFNNYLIDKTTKDKDGKYNGFTL
jgi:hypothetical protein